MNSRGVSAAGTCGFTVVANAGHLVNAPARSVIRNSAQAAQHSPRASFANGDACTANVGEGRTADWLSLTIVRGRAGATAMHGD
jgi:hypothetical protein